MKAYFDNRHGDRHWLAQGNALRQSLSGLRIPSTRDVQISKPVRAQYQRVLDRVTVSTQVLFTVTDYFTKHALLGNPSQAALDRASLFVIELNTRYAAQTEGLLTLIFEWDRIETVRQYRGLMTSIDPQQIGATVRTSYRFDGADFIIPE